MDTIAELAFLAMDCEARGLSAQSRLLINDYLEYSGDYAGLAMLNWYRCYFAMVRAKVNLLRVDPDVSGLSETPAYHDFLRYLELARGFARPSMPFLAITCGVSGSGKSTVAKAMFEATGAIRIRSDVERKRLYDLAPESASGSATGGGIYTPDASAATFSRLHELAQACLEAGFGCIVDATFLRRKQRKPYRALARLTYFFALIRLLDAVIHRIAHQMHHWIRQRLDQILVQVGLFALQFQVDFLVQTAHAIARLLVPPVTTGKLFHVARQIAIFSNTAFNSARTSSTYCLRAVQALVVSICKGGLKKSRPLSV